MDFLEVEGKTYEEAVRKAATELNADVKDLDIEVRKSIQRVSLACSGARRFGASHGCTARLKRRHSKRPKRRLRSMARGSWWILHSSSVSLWR